MSPRKSPFILLLKLWFKLSPLRQKQLVILLIVMITSGLAELLSLGAVLPFLAILGSPEQLWNFSLIRRFATIFGITTSYQLLFLATGAFVAAAVLAALVRLLNLFLNVRLAAEIGADFSAEAYMRTLNQPYEFQVQRNSSEIISGIVTHVSRTIGALSSFLALATSAIVAISLFIGMLLIDLKVAASAAALFGSAYALIAAITKKQLVANSSLIASAAVKVIKAVQEGLGAIRDVLLDGSQSFYLDIYVQSDRRQRQLQARNDFLSSFPRFALEALGISGIALLGFLLVQQKGYGSGVVPILGALALGAQRLLPALQQVYLGWSALNGSTADLSAVLQMLNQPLPLSTKLVQPLEFQKGIVLQNINFRYGPSQPDVVRGLNIEIRRGERIGFVGTTGSGKSTTMDLLMGLLVPSEGLLLVDGLDIHDVSHPDRVAAWRAAIAHVPQSIFLADSSFAENIAFGLPKDQIDLDRVRIAAAKAQIASFIESLADDYSSFVGERGVRLSGGQRQRIGIARALYKQAQLIVLDEATSALDSVTEQAVMDSIESLGSDLTILIIAHRLTTVQRCDRIFKLDKGAIVGSFSPKNIPS